MLFVHVRKSSITDVCLSFKDDVWKDTLNLYSQCLMPLWAVENDQTIKQVIAIISRRRNERATFQLRRLIPFHSAALSTRAIPGLTNRRVPSAVLSPIFYAGRIPTLRRVQPEADNRQWIANRHHSFWLRCPQNWHWSDRRKRTARPKTTREQLWEIYDRW